MFKTEKVAIIDYNDLPEYMRYEVAGFGGFAEGVYLDLTSDLVHEGFWITKLRALEELTAGCNDRDFKGTMQEYAEQHGFVTLYWIAETGVDFSEVDKVLVHIRIID